MLLQRYLVVGKKNRHNSSARLTKNAPSLESYEIAIKLSLDIPNELFNKPQLQASIIVPKDAVTAPIIEAEVIDNIKETISKELGIDLNISLLENK